MRLNCVGSILFSRDDKASRGQTEKFKLLVALVVIEDWDEAKGASEMNPIVP